MTGIEIIGAKGLFDLGIGAVSLGEALAGVGAVVGAAGAISGAESQAAAAEFNEEQARQDAAQEREIARREADDFRRRNSRILAASRARRAGSGVTGQGTPLLVDEATASEIELGAQDILAGGSNRARALENEAELERSRARSARTGGFTTAGATLLTAGARFG